MSVWYVSRTEDPLMIGITANTLISVAQGSWNIGYIPVDSIDGKEVQFLEKRKIYVDHGDFQEQYLKQSEGSVSEIQALCG